MGILVRLLWPAFLYTKIVVHIMQYTELLSILDSFSSTLLGKYPHRYLAFDLTHRNNSPLADMLLTDGYWDFAPTRSSRLIGAHQIIAFYFLPKPSHASSGADVEVHHINGNTTDNTPDNLMFLTPGDHALVTKFQRRLAKLSLKTFTKVHLAMVHTPFNRRGKPIHNWARFMLVTIALTVTKTQGWVRTFSDNATHKLMPPIKSLIANIHRLLRSLAPIITSPLHALCSQRALKSHINPSLKAHGL